MCENKVKPKRDDKHKKNTIWINLKHGQFDATNHPTKLTVELGYMCPLGLSGGNTEEEITLLLILLKNKLYMGNI